MKTRLSKALCGVALAALFLLTGCKDDASVAMWWLPDPWTPMQPVVTTSTSTSGGSTSSGGAVAGGN